MPPLTVTLTINNPEDPARAAVAAAVGGTPANAALESKDLYKAIYSEAMSDYRYFGTLRAAVAWAPAIVTVGLIGALIARGLVVSQLYVWAPVVGVFLLIYIANHYLQIEQRKRRIVARKAERLMVKPDGLLRTYPELVDATIDGVRASPTKLWPDGPSFFLILFFLLLGGLVYLTQTGYVAVQEIQEPPAGVSPAPQQQSPPDSDQQ